MNRAFLPLAKSLLVALLAVSGLTGQTYAAEEQAAAKADPAKGEALYTNGDAGRNIPACAGCHSPNGAGIPNQYPRLAGQYQDYTAAQLINFRTGARKNSVQMVTIAKRMSDDEMKAVADYVAGLK